MSLKNLSVDFAFYGLLDLLQRSVGLVMVPLYTRVLSQREYGDLDIILIVSVVLLVVVDLQFVSGFQRFFLRYRSEGQGRRFVGTVIMSRLIGGTAISAVFIFLGLSGHIEFKALPSFAGHSTAWILAATLVPVSLTYEILLIQTRMLRWKTSFAIGAVSNTVISCVVSVLLVVVLKWGIAGVVLGLLLGKLIGMLFMAWALRDEIDPCLDRTVLKVLVPYCAPLIPGWWVGFGSAYVGRFFIYGAQGADENAILAVCMKVTAVIGLYSVSFRSAWQPLAMAYIGDTSGEAFYVSSMRLFSAGLLLSIFCLAAFLHPLLAVLTPGSYGAVEYYFPLFAVGTLIGECESNLQLGNQIARTTHWIAISSLVSVVINIGILMVFTQSLGIVAVGLGLALSSLGKGLVTYVSAQRSCRIPYDTRSLVLMGVGCAGLLFLGFGMQRRLILGWVFSGCAALLGIAVPWFMLAPVERQQITRLVKARLLTRQATP